MLHENEAYFDCFEDKEKTVFIIRFPYCDVKSKVDIH